MGALGNAIEGGFVIAGNSGSKGVMLTNDHETVVCKAYNTAIVLAGEGSNIYNDMPLPTYSYGESETSYNNNNYRYDWLDDGKFEPAIENKLITTGENCRIFSGINGQEPYSATRFYVLGNNSELNTSSAYFNINNPPVGSNGHSYHFPINAIVDGYASKVTMQDIENIKPTGSVIVSVGEKNELDNPGEDSVLAIFGESSSIRTEYNKSVDYIFSGSHQATIESFNEDAKTRVLVANKAKSINVNGETFLLASESPESFTVGKDSAVAIGWHDGTRQRISVFYEGEDIEVGKHYRVNDSGQLVEVN